MNRSQSFTVFSQNYARFARLVKVKLEGAGPDTVARLRAALVPHKPGSTPIRLLHCTASLRTELDLGDEWRVRASSALRDALLTIPGVQDVEFVVARANTAAPKLAEAG